MPGTERDADPVLAAAWLEIVEVTLPVLDIGVEAAVGNDFHPVAQSDAIA